MAIASRLRWNQPGLSHSGLTLLCCGFHVLQLRVAGREFGIKTKNRIRVQLCAIEMNLDKALQNYLQL
jgi:hypothetical protein